MTLDVAARASNASYDWSVTKGKKEINSSKQNQFAPLPDHREKSPPTSRDKTTTFAGIDCVKKCKPETGAAKKEKMGGGSPDLPEGQTASEKALKKKTQQTPA